MHLNSNDALQNEVRTCKGRSQCQSARPDCTLRLNQDQPQVSVKKQIWNSLTLASKCTLVFNVVFEKTCPVTAAAWKLNQTLFSTCKFSFPGIIGDWKILETPKIATQNHKKVYSISPPTLNRTPVCKHCNSIRVELHCPNPVTNWVNDPHLSPTWFYFFVNNGVLHSQYVPLADLTTKFKPTGGHDWGICHQTKY